jgi:GNAT superfamily N-acetyltransferase
MTDEYRLLEESISVVDFLRLRRAVGWSDVDAEAVEIGLSNSLFAVSVHHQGQVVGFGRVIGDDGLYFSIQDVMVLPRFQGQGLGERILQRLMAYVASRAHKESFVGLMAARGVKGFYEKWGFQERPASAPGMFLIWGGD